MARWLGVVAALGLAGAAHAAPDGVRALPSSAAEIRFVVEVPAPRFAPVSESSPRTRLKLEGYENVSKPGLTGLPQRIVTVAVPRTGEVRVDAIGTGRTVLDDIRLPLTPILPRESRMTESEAEAETEANAPPDEPTASLFGSGVRARLQSVGWMRNQRVARIVILPADYDRSAGRLVLDRRIEVVVTVSGEPAPVAGESRPAEDPDPFERVYRRTLVNYEQGRGWRRTAAARGLMRSAVDVVQGTPPVSSVFAGRSWIKIVVDSAGFYRVGFDQLRAQALFNHDETVRLENLRLFTWPGFPNLPENTYCDSCDYREVAMGFVEVSQDTVFNVNAEYLYFHAQGASDWHNIYDPVLADTSFLNNPYERHNYFYLTISTPESPVAGPPLRIATASGAVTGGGVTPATFPARVHAEMDLEYFPDFNPNVDEYRSNLFWEKWWWRQFTAGAGPVPFVATAPGVDLTEPVRFRLRGWGSTRNSPRTPTVFDHYLDITVGGVALPVRRWNNRWAITVDTTLTGVNAPNDEVTVILEAPLVHDSNPTFDAKRIDRSLFAWFELYYARRFVPVANALDFESPAGGGSILYDIEPFTLEPAAKPRVFDVTDPLTPVEILGGEYTGDVTNGWRLRFQRAETGLRRYRVIPDDRILRVPTASVFMAPNSSATNLRATPGGGQAGGHYLVIYYDGFQAAAESLAVWRRARLPLQDEAPPYQTVIVPVSALFDQFSGGRMDPGALRNFLRAAFYNWNPAPRFVTLLGDASYDFKDIRGLAGPGLPGTLLPSFENGFDPFVDRQFASDDWMLSVTDALELIPDYFGGRIPAPDAAGALAYVRDKLLRYERAAPFGEWRNRVLLVADDHEQGASIDGLGWSHVSQTAKLDSLLPDATDRERVYLHTYPDGANETKPLAKADIIKTINGDGVVMWNYIGHGSPIQLADERIFLESDAGQFTNTARPTLFVAASCDVGKYNDPRQQSLGERLVMDPGGGCIAVISATEVAFSNQNAALNGELYRQLFERDPTTGQFHTSTAEALLDGKTGSVNGQKYQVMGDAAGQIVFPRLYVELELTDEAGTPITILPRGQVARFRGIVTDRPGGVVQPLNGAAGILIEDSVPIDTTFACGWCLRTPYPFKAAPLFRGDARVVNGEVNGQFVVPLDAALGARARVRAYVNGAIPAVASATDGAGSSEFTLMQGSAPSGDEDGPRIALSFGGGSTNVRGDATLRIDLFDPSGILITGYTLQNGVIVTIDGNSNQRVDVTSSFRYSADSYQAGAATFRLPGLAPGPHTLSVSAADNLASGINAARHRSSASINFEVSEIPPLSVRHAFLFPNPTRSGGPQSGGQFVIEAPGDTVNALLHIYTVAGRRIRTLRSQPGLGQVQIPWDGLDAEGERLAAGVYLFRVQVNAREAGGGNDAKSQAVAEGRVVILGR